MSKVIVAAALALCGWPAFAQEHEQAHPSSAQEQAAPAHDEHAQAPAQHDEHAAPAHDEHAQPAQGESGQHGEHGAAHEEHGSAHGEHGGSHDAHKGSPWELKLSFEAPLFTHLTRPATAESAGGSVSTNIGSTFELGASIALAYIIVPHRMTIDFEVTQSELFGSDIEEGTPRSNGVTFRLGSSYRPFEKLPLYVLVMTTHHIDPYIFGVRGGAGWLIPLGHRAILSLEASVDLPIAGSGDEFPGAFKQQQLIVSAGLLFHL